MSAVQMSHIDLEQGNRRFSVDVSPEGSLCFSDAEDGSCYSLFYSTAGGSYDDYRFDCVNDHEIGDVEGSGRASSASECSVEMMDSTNSEIKVHLGTPDRDCRICHLSLESVNPETGIAIELGCLCKNDLAAAHKSCAERWFKIKGNKTCEICNSTARNVVGVCEVETARQSIDANNVAATAAALAASPVSETRSFWQGHRFLNCLLACMVFAFVISWLFHFNVPS